MPDISLLQKEYFTPEEEESELPGIVLTASLVMLIVVVGAYVGLYFYGQILESRAGDVSRRIAELKVGDVEKSLEELRTAGKYLSSVKTLREAHAFPTRAFAHLERSTHPSVYFTALNFDVAKGSAQLQAVAATPLVLARQVEIYEGDVAAGRIAGFSVGSIGYGENHTVKFGLDLATREQAAPE